MVSFLGDIIRGKTNEGVKIDILRTISVGRLSTGVAGEVSSESLGKAKCELETRSDCVYSPQEWGHLPVSLELPVRTKGSHFLFFCSFLCLAFHISVFFLSFFFLVLLFLPSVT